jgi:hypothetical protein
VKKSTPPDHPPLAPEEDLTKANARWTTSSTPSARTTRTCATPFGTAETSGIPWGTTDPSNLCRLPHHEEDLENLDNPNSRRGGGGGAFPHVDGEVNIIFGGHGSQESKRQQKLNDRQILVATVGPPAPYRWSEHPITFTRADQWLNFDHPGNYPLLVDSVIRESRVKKVLVDGEAASTSPFPGRSKAWEFPSKSSMSRTLLSLASCRLKENIHWDTSTCRSPLELRKTIEPSF